MLRRTLGVKRWRVRPKPILALKFADNMLL
jgi:hypothetical protein